MKNPGTPYRLEMRADSLSSNVRTSCRAPRKPCGLWPRSGTGLGPNHTLRSGRDCPRGLEGVLGGMSRQAQKGSKGLPLWLGNLGTVFKPLRTSLPWEEWRPLPGQGCTEVWAGSCPPLKPSGHSWLSLSAAPNLLPTSPNMSLQPIRLLCSGEFFRQEYLEWVAMPSSSTESWWGVYMFGDFSPWGFLPSPSPPLGFPPWPWAQVDRSPRNTTYFVATSSHMQDLSSPTRD